MILARYTSTINDKRACIQVLRRLARQAFCHRARDPDLGQGPVQARGCPGMSLNPVRYRGYLITIIIYIKSVCYIDIFDNLNLRLEPSLLNIWATYYSSSLQMIALLRLDAKTCLSQPTCTSSHM